MRGRRRDARRDLHRQGRRRDARPRPPATITEVLAAAGDTVTVGQVIARMTRAVRAGPPTRAVAGAAPATPPRAPAGARAGRPLRWRQGLARRPPGGHRPGRRPRRGDRQRARRAHREGRRDRRRRPAAGRGAPAAAARAATLIKGAAAMLARYMDESRPIPTATSFRTVTVTTLDGRRKELKAAGRKVSFTHLIAYALARAATDIPVMAHHFAEVDGKPQPRRRRRGQPGPRGRRREEGRLADADGPGDPRRRAPHLRRVPRRLQRAGREGPHQLAHRRRPQRRQRHPHQPGRPRHDRLGPAAHGRPGHDRRHGLDRLSGRARRGRRGDRRREGHDDDLDLRPPDHPGRRVRPLPRPPRGAAAGRGRLLRGRVRARSGVSRRSGAAPSPWRPPRPPRGAGLGPAGRRPDRRGDAAGRPGRDLAAQGPPDPRPPRRAARPARHGRRGRSRRSTPSRSA